MAEWAVCARASSPIDTCVRDQLASVWLAWRIGLWDWLAGWLRCWLGWLAAGLAGWDGWAVEILTRSSLEEIGGLVWWPRRYIGCGRVGVDMEGS